MKRRSKILIIAYAGLSAILFSNCKEANFKIKGEISEGKDQSLVLERSDFHGRWIAVDSVKIKDNGHFSLTFPSPASPDIFRLSLNDKYVYLPIDSTETITLQTSLNGFGRDFILEGSDKAKNLELFEKEIQGLNVGHLHSDSLDQFKRRIYTKYIKDNQGSIVSFYILTKTINEEPLFSPSDPNDAKYFGAVATGFKTLRPDDPHTALLEQTTLNAFKNRNSNNGKFMEIEADEVSLIEIDLQDDKGNNIKLSDVAGHGKPVILIFSVLTHPDSPALNYALAQVYERHKGKVEFYNVSIDPDQYSWREAAVNLPWVTVYAPAEFNSDATRKYNVTEVPTFFLYNSDGELTGRFYDLNELEKKL